MLTMPIIPSNYIAKHLWKNPHLNTLYPAIFRSVKGLELKRERLELTDGDFLDLDWAGSKQSKRLLVAIHGLEGNARRPYMLGIMKRFVKEGFDAVGINMRGCSGKENRFLRTYHSGKSEDLGEVIEHVILGGQYEEVVLVGFSAGGNIVLKYLGEKGAAVPKQIKCAIAFSAPCCLAGSCSRFEERGNAFYLWQFLYTLKRKVKNKIRLHPEEYVNWEAIRGAKFFEQFDDHFTAAVNGFADAKDYYKRASSIFVVDKITIPTLLVSAKDDSFLNIDCFPIAQAERMSNFYLEMPDFGGHLGFMSPDVDGFLFTENRAWSFVQAIS
jgi:uncharacterized protein